MSFAARLAALITPELPEADEQVRAAASTALAETAIRLNLVVAALAPPTALTWVVLLWPHSDQNRLLAWLGIVTCTSLTMVVTASRYRRSEPRATLVATQLSYGLAAAGAAWGALGAIAMPDETAWQAVVGMMLLSTMAVNAIFAASVTRMFWAFQLPVAAVGAVTFFTLGTGLGRAIGFVICYALPFSAVLAWINRATNERAAFFTVISRNTSEELRMLNSRLSHEASHDPLTGIPNRQAFTRRLEEAVATHPGQVAVLFMDLDDFKLVNDRYGHAVGDRVLELAARRILGRLRPHDVLARLGGDEFTAIIEGVHSVDDVESVARRILEGFEAPFELEGTSHRLGISIGVSLPPDPASADRLLHHADSALYEAKRDGRGRYAVFSATGS